MTGDIIILTGPPAAGKSTVAELVAAGADHPSVHLVTDMFYRAIRSGFVLPYLPQAQQQNEVVVEAIVAAAVAYARGGYDVIVDGIVGPWFLPPFRDAAQRERLALSYIVLRPDLETTLARARERVGDELKDVDAITGMHRAFARLDDLERYVIDSGSLSSEQTAAAVQEAVRGGNYLLA